MLNIFLDSITQVKVSILWFKYTSVKVEVSSEAFYSSTKSIVKSTCKVTKYFYLATRQLCQALICNIFRIARLTSTKTCLIFFITNYHLNIYFFAAAKDSSSVEHINGVILLTFPLSVLRGKKQTLISPVQHLSEETQWMVPFVPQRKYSVERDRWRQSFLPINHLISPLQP